MEEIMKKKLGLCRMDSSELTLIRGGAAKTTWSNIFEKIRNLVDFIGDYIPKLIQGFTDGLLGVKLFS